MTEPYILIAPGVVQGFDADDEPLFESKGSFKFRTPEEQMLMIVGLARKCGIERLEFMNGGSVLVATATDLELLLYHRLQQAPNEVPTEEERRQEELRRDPRYQAALAVLRHLSPETL